MEWINCSIVIIWKDGSLGGAYHCIANIGCSARLTARADMCIAYLAFIIPFGECGLVASFDLQYPSVLDAVKLSVTHKY